ncbi:serpin family protein [Bacillus sp. Bva_UNVM-123]|uniref:serpin family protein n=1 Tax=Bacillus sp. Bva_UNVM-123 TaxID=2829798 RepID=UPI00391F069E
MKKTILLILLASLLVYVTGCGLGNQQGSLQFSSNIDFGKNDYKKMISSNNQLGFELLSQVKGNEDGNIFISPTSLLMALSMVYNGADGVTKEEIAKVLHADGMDVLDLNKANASLLSMLYHDSKQIQLNVANSIWLNQKFHFQTDFAQNNKDYFHANIQEIDILDSQSPQLINDWVKKSTNHKIEEIVDAPLDPDLVAILINAIYFKGSWQDEFKKKETEKRTFYLGNGATKETPLMRLHKKMSHMENESFQAVSLPYGDGEMSMKVFLPKENASVETFKNKLTNDNWKEWSSQFQQKEGTLLLPKFQMEYEVLLNDALKKLGMTTAFDKGANFAKMIEENDPIWINIVKQKTFIDVNEEGTEAAAATSVEMKTESAPLDQPFHMEVNRPFFLMISDDTTGAILFIGEIANPEAGE